MVENRIFLVFFLSRNRIFLLLWKKKVCSVLTGNTLLFSPMHTQQKATKKTDKSRSEEKDDLDITELTNEDLQEQLVKYGLNPGPIVGRLTELANNHLFNVFLTKS